MENVIKCLAEVGFKPDPRGSSLMWEYAGDRLLVGVHKYSEKMTLAWGLGTPAGQLSNYLEVAQKTESLQQDVVRLCNEAICKLRSVEGAIHVQVVDSCHARDNWISCLQSLCLRAMTEMCKETDSLPSPLIDRLLQLRKMLADSQHSEMAAGL